MTVAIRNVAELSTAERPRTPEALAEALFRPMGVDGVYARTRLYEDVVERLSALISRQREPGTEVLRFPPVMSRRELEKSGYLKSFPNLLGCVCALHGSEADIRAAADRHRSRRRLDRFAVAGRSRALPRRLLSRSIRWPRAAAPVPAGGLLFDVPADCFRHEPSRDLDRLQSFRMREYVCIGSAAEVTDFRERWMDARAAHRRRARPALPGRAGQRSVLRPHRPGDGDRASCSSR